MKAVVKEKTGVGEVVFREKGMLRIGRDGGAN